MTSVSEVPRLAWRHSAGSLWGWIMQRNDNRVVRLIPNLLTLSRFGLVATGILTYRYFIADKMPQAWIWLGITIFLFGLTDWLDGKSARSLEVVSNFGRIVDPITDKTAAATLFVLFAMAVNRPGFVAPDLAHLTTVMIAMILFMESLLLYTAITNWIARRVPGANGWGKKKLNAEIITLGFGYLLLYLTPYGFPHAVAPVIVCLLAAPIVFCAVLSLQGHLEARRP